MYSCFQNHGFVSINNDVLVRSVALHLADSDDEDGEDEDSQGHPGHVCLEAPGLSKVAPTLEDPWSHF